MSDTTALAIVHEMWHEPGQLDIIKKMIAKDATDEELALFAMRCRSTGLDPFVRQIYGIKRGTTFTIQTGIDGFWLLAGRTKELGGNDETVYEGITESDGIRHPSLARVKVYRMVQGQRIPFTAVARWEEYAQYFKGKEGKPYLGDMWKKMPFRMLEKCAESLALRRAFPAELSNLYSTEEMSQADEGTIPGTYVDADPMPAPRALQPSQPARTAPKPAPKPAPKAASNGNGTWNPLADREFRMAMNALDYRSVAQVEEWLKSQHITDRTAAMDAIQTETAARTNTTAVDAEYTYEVADNGDPDLLRQVGTNGVH